MIRVLTSVEKAARGRASVIQREDHMPRYLGLFRYSPEGAKGLLKEKAAAREAAIRKFYEDIGGKVEATYWMIGGEYSGRCGCGAA